MDLTCHSLTFFISAMTKQIPVGVGNLIVKQKTVVTIYVTFMNCQSKMAH